MQTAFEKYLVSGRLARKGAADNGHHPVLEAVRLQNRSKSPQRPTDNVMLRGNLETLQPGQTLCRVWRCHKPGFQALFKLDDWKHTEKIHKTLSHDLVVQDHIAWHESRSIAHREYVVRSVDGSMTVSLGKWNIAMNGLSWPVRGRVEKILRRELPAKADKSISDFYDSRSIEK